MTNAGLLVSMLVAARAIAAGLVFHLLAYGLRSAAIAVFLFACISDVVDGRLGKRFDAASIWGPYGDAVADCVLVLVVCAALVLEGVYPTWLPIVLLVMFGQFVATSGLERPVYDPIGKYYGGFLYASLTLTFLVPHPTVARTALLAVVAATVGTLTSRTVFLVRRRRCVPVAS